jgi:hypothetical protein
MRYTCDETTARQEELYSFLLGRGDQWTPMRDIPDHLYLTPSPRASGNFHNSGARRQLTRDIEAINGSGDYDKIIISGNQGIKLATKDEFERFVRAEMREIFRKIRRVRKILRKGSLDQQQTIRGEIVQAFLGQMWRA